MTGITLVLQPLFFITIIEHTAKVIGCMPFVFALNRINKVSFS